MGPILIVTGGAVVGVSVHESAMGRWCARSSGGVASVAPIRPRSLMCDREGEVWASSDPVFVFVLLYSPGRVVLAVEPKIG